MIHAVVINAKGGGRALKRMLTLKHECPEALDSIPWLEAETVSEAALFLHQLPSTSRVLVDGGGGTVNRLLASVISNSLQLALMPLGSGNDLARSLGLNRRLRHSAWILREANPFDVSIRDKSGLIKANITLFHAYALALMRQFAKGRSLHPSALRDLAGIYTQRSLPLLKWKPGTLRLAQPIWSCMKVWLFLLQHSTHQASALMCLQSLMQGLMTVPSM
jgi:hypothetical protein